MSDLSQVVAVFAFVGSIFALVYTIDQLGARKRAIAEPRIERDPLDCRDVGLRDHIEVQALSDNQDPMKSIPPITCRHCGAGRSFNFCATCGKSQDRRIQEMITERLTEKTWRHVYRFGLTDFN